VWRNNLKFCISLTKESQSKYIDVFHIKAICRQTVVGELNLRSRSQLLNFVNYFAIQLK